MPWTIAEVLTTNPRVGGKVGFRWCSALLKPESLVALATIREHLSMGRRRPRSFLPGGRCSGLRGS
jgi:hypothetical protein